MAEINLTSRFSDKVDERFRQRSLTDMHAGHAYEFSGVRSVKVYSVDSVPVGDYTRTGQSRFGTANELGDTVQELTMGQDKAFTFTIDRGNAAEQLNLKHAARRLRTNWDEVCTPLIDRYRFSRWMNGAGMGKVNSTALTSSTVMAAIFDAGAEMSNSLVPVSGRTLFIRQSLFTKVKLSDQIMGIERLGQGALSNGIVGELDGMKVVPVPDSYFPAGVCFLIKYRNATVDPMRLQTFRVHKDPPGIDGDLAECRFYFDSFVLGNKVNGLYVYAQSGMCQAPTVAISDHSATITGEAGETVIYTTDGTDPKTSGTAKTYTEAVTTTAGMTVRAYASKSGLVNSPIAEAVDE